MSLPQNSDYQLVKVGAFMKVTFTSASVPDEYIYIATLGFRKSSSNFFSILKSDEPIFTLDGTRCTNISSVDTDDLLDQLSTTFITEIAQAPGTQTEISSTQWRQVPPLGMGLEARIRAGTTTEYEPPASMHMESNYINTIETSFGMPRFSNEKIFSFKLSVSNLQVTSTSIEDNPIGTGAISILMVGLTNIGGVWADIQEVIVLNGQTPVTTVSGDWWRINNIIVLNTNSANYNVGDIYITDAGAATTNGIPDIGVPIRGAVIAGFNKSTMGIFSVKTGYTLLLTRGNFYTVANTNNPIIVHGLLWADVTGAGKLNQYNAGYYGLSGPIGYNYDSATPIYQQSDFDGRIYSISGTIASTVYYQDYVLVPNASFVP